jgi:hypothetical protein
MKRRGYVVRYLLSTAFWVCAFNLNYPMAGRSILSISDSLWLPNFVVPGAFALMSLAFLWVALTIEPNRALFDTRATLAVRIPLVVWVARIVSSLAVIASGVVLLIGPARPELNYSGPGAGLTCIVIGASSLAFVVERRRWIELSQAGIDHPQVRPRLVAWQDVVEIKSRRWLFSKLVQVKFREGAGYRLAPRPWRWREERQFTIFPLFFGVDADILANALSMRRDTHVF